MTISRMTGWPDCTIMYNLIDKRTHVHTHAYTHRHTHTQRHTAMVTTHCCCECTINNKGRDLQLVELVVHDSLVHGVRVLEVGDLPRLVVNNTQLPIPTPSTTTAKHAVFKSKEQILYIQSSPSLGRSMRVA